MRCARHHSRGVAKSRAVVALLPTHLGEVGLQQRVNLSRGAADVEPEGQGWQAAGWERDGCGNGRGFQLDVGFKTVCSSNLGRRGPWVKVRLRPTVGPAPASRQLWCSGTSHLPCSSGTGCGATVTSKPRNGPKCRCSAAHVTPSISAGPCSARQPWASRSVGV